MSKHLQQLNDRLQHASHKAGVAVRAVSLQANLDLALVLVLVIIPTLSGVALIA